MHCIRNGLREVFNSVAIIRVDKRNFEYKRKKYEFFIANDSLNFRSF